MGRLEELRLITKVATLYYQQGLRQAEVAERLDLSQASVSRLLKRGESEGIVRITVAAPMGVYPQLEDALKERYGLKEVIVVDGSDDPSELLHHLGAAASRGCACHRAGRVGVRSVARRGRAREALRRAVDRSFTPEAGPGLSTDRGCRERMP